MKVHSIVAWQYTTILLRRPSLCILILDVEFWLKWRRRRSLCSSILVQLIMLIIQTFIFHFSKNILKEIKKVEYSLDKAMIHNVLKNSLHSYQVLFGINNLRINFQFILVNQKWKILKISCLTKWLLLYLNWMIMLTILLVQINLLLFYLGLKRTKTKTTWWNTKMLHTSLMIRKKFISRTVPWMMTIVKKLLLIWMLQEEWCHKLESFLMDISNLNLILQLEIWPKHCWVNGLNQLPMTLQNHISGPKENQNITMVLSKS